MLLDNFKVEIPEGRNRDDGYVDLSHGQQYTLKLNNYYSYRDCDATVEIDGKKIGVFRVKRSSCVKIERSPNDHGRFTFYTSGSSEAVDCGSEKIRSENAGLIKVTFTPEKEKPYDVVRPILGFCGLSTNSEMDFDSSEQHTNCSKGRRTRSTTQQVGQSGITGLSGHSDQNFVEVPNLDYDESLTTTIYIRLIQSVNCKHHELKPCHPVAKRSTKIPAPLS